MNQPRAAFSLQPSQECHDLLVQQVVGELRCDDEIEFLRRPVGEGIVVYKFDPGGRVSRVSRGAAGPGVQIDTRSASRLEIAGGFSGVHRRGRRRRLAKKSCLLRGSRARTAWGDGSW